MLPDLQILAIGAVATLFAGISKGGFGSGASFAAAPILATVIDPRMALGLLLPLLMLIDLVTLRSFWRAWEPRAAWVLCLGAVPGVALGAGLYQVANADAFRLLIGGISLAFVAYQLAKQWGWLKVSPGQIGSAWGVATGTAAGFTSFVSHAGGPPVAVYLLASGMDKTGYQATTVIVFWVINILKAVPYTFLGIFTFETLLLDLWLAPVAVLGALIGVRAHHIVPQNLFFAITYVLLVVTGSKLIWDGLV